MYNYLKIRGYEKFNEIFPMDPFESNLVSTNHSLCLHVYERSVHLKFDYVLFPAINFAVRYLALYLPPLSVTVVVVFANVNKQQHKQQQ